jgi:predicted GIY-YIG superfamily endonuclease
MISSTGSHSIKTAPSGYTSSRRPITLVHSELFDTRDDAFLRERQIKGWSRAKKAALVRGDWTEVQRLSKSARPPTDQS